MTDNPSTARNENQSHFMVQSDKSQWIFHPLTKDQDYGEDHRLCLTCYQFPDVHIRGFPQQPHQGWDSSAVLQGDFVVVVGFPVDEVPQGSAGAPVNLSHPMIKQIHQQRDTTLPPDLRDRQNNRSLPRFHPGFCSFPLGVFRHVAALTVLDVIGLSFEFAVVSKIIYLNTFQVILNLFLKCRRIKNSCHS